MVKKPTKDSCFHHIVIDHQEHNADKVRKKFATQNYKMELRPNTYLTIQAKKTVHDPIPC